jgi:ATPase subunit of ABC transporter with duplicated ATPase domains
MDIQAAVSSALEPHLDSDACEYITSLLSEDANDEDSREAVGALIAGSVLDDQFDPEEITAAFFALLDISNVASEQEYAEEPALRKLDQAVTMKEHDVTTYASGLTSGVDSHGNTIDTEKQSDIASFYANMIDISSNEAAMSERARRKQRQKELRERMDAEERLRAIDEAMAMLEDTPNDAEESMKEANAVDNSADVHLKNFDLSNLRGGGPNLLDNASLTLAKGRRYGLMGRNGCGKTTLLTFLASRQIPGAVPKNMSMLLVRQEIMGNEWTAVETVLKSDVKRESVKRFITWCEEELEKLENGITAVEEDDAVDKSDAPKAKGDRKNRQKLRDRKQQNMASKVAKKNNFQDESKEQKKAKLTEKLGKAYERLAMIEEVEGGDPEPKARKILAGLGFTPEMQDKPTMELSGGWRMRVSLSCALFANPSLLLLDEPTNHLDLEAVLWLEKFLTTTFTGTLVVVSHDRHFLNEIVTDVVHFHRGNLKTFRGDISNFEGVREEDRIRQIRLREQQEAKREHLQKYIDLHAQAGENGVKAARQRKSKQKKLDKLGVMAQDGKKWKASYDGDADEVEDFKEDEEVELTFPDPGGFDGDIIRLEQVEFGYSPDKILLSDVDLSISLSSRAALLGRNGMGKSTLIKLAVGGLQPSKGKAVIDNRAKIEYLAQHQLEQLDPDSTPLQTMIDRYPGDHSNSHIGDLRRYLANFGLGGEVLPIQKIHTMSGGQKCRLCLACAMYRRPHLLILDEPTNHLDLETTQALIEAIREFQGGVLIVSHDQHLLTSVCKNIYVVEHGGLEELREGNSAEEAFQAYKRAIVLGKR